MNQNTAVAGFKLPDFTGNWFVDANIYGLYKCMKNGGVAKSIDEEIRYSNKELYGIYPVSYVFSQQSRTVIAEILTKKEGVEAIHDICQGILSVDGFNSISDTDTEKILDCSLDYIKYKIKEFKNLRVDDDYINEIYINSDKNRREMKIKSIKKLQGQDLEKNPVKHAIQFYKNYSFTQKADFDKFKKAFKDQFPIGDKEEIRKNIDTLFDKVGNKFLFSKKEFRLLSYASNSISVDSDAMQLSGTYPFVLINYNLGLNKVSPKRNLFFYSPSRELAFSVNEKISMSVNEKGSKANNPQLIPSITSSILELRERTWFSLNQMFYIEHENVDNMQNLPNVKYIGFSPAMATLLTSDKIAEVLSRSLPVDKDKKTWKSLLNEVTIGNSLTQVYLDNYNATGSFKPKIEALAIDCLFFDKRMDTDQASPYRVSPISSITLENFEKKRRKLAGFRKIASAIKDKSSSKIPFERLVRLVRSRRLDELNFEFSRCILNSNVNDEIKNKFADFICTNTHQNYWPAYSSAFITGLRAS